MCPTVMPLHKSERGDEGGTKDGDSYLWNARSRVRPRRESPRKMSGACPRGEVGNKGWGVQSLCPCTPSPGQQSTSEDFTCNLWTLTGTFVETGPAFHVEVDRGGPRGGSSHNVYFSEFCTATSMFSGSVRDDPVPGQPLLRDFLHNSNSAMDDGRGDA